MLRLAERRTRLSVVDDQIGCPTYTVDLARLICQMAEQNAQGVFHAGRQRSTGELVRLCPADF